MSSADNRQRIKLLWTIVVVSQVFLALAVAYLYAAFNNTLAHNGNWVSTKTTLPGGIMSALIYTTDCKTLAREQIDLGRWHGYQEILYRQPLSLDAVSFDLLLDEDAYALFIFNKTDQGFSGLRISRNERFASIFFNALNDGQFVASQPLATHDQNNSTWMPIKVQFMPREVSAFMGDQLIGRFEVDVADPQVIGFRGSEKRAVIDSVRMHCDDGTRIVEHFFNVTGFVRSFLVVFAILLILDAVVHWFVKQRRTKPLWGAFFSLTATWSTMFCFLIIIFAYNFFLSKSYPRGSKLREQDFRVTRVNKKIQHIFEQYSGTPEPGMSRVLFIGSSQTKGTGATKAEDTIDRVAERSLNARSTERQFECINSGISALYAEWLLRLYTDEWYKLSPQIVVINLSNNDSKRKDDDSFVQALEGFVSACRKNGSRLLFVLEANSVERTPGELRLHARMREVANLHGVRIIDAHAYLKSVTERGLIWWDFVHPTSFGHRMIAELLVPEIEELAEEISNSQ